jgi:hypothetical protein
LRFVDLFAVMLDIFIGKIGGGGGSQLSHPEIERQLCILTHTVSYLNIAKASQTVLLSAAFNYIYVPEALFQNVLPIESLFL